MEKLIVEGGIPITGEITPAGNKNEALPVLAAVLLTDEPVVVHNVPDIGDIRDMLELLEGLGVTVEHAGERSYRLQAGEVKSDRPEEDIARRIRGSILLAGPLLARRGSVTLAAPGGDRIGMRRLDTHLLVLEQMGAHAEEKGQGVFRFTLPESLFRGGKIFLDEASVTATANAVMAAVCAEGLTEIENAACEPHIRGLCRMLQAMGANISGAGTNFLQIEGVTSLSGCEHAIMPDHTEVGSFIGLAAVTGGEILIRDAGLENLRMIRLMFERLGVTTVEEGAHLRVPKDQEKVIRLELDDAIPKIDDGPWPAFPSDLTSIMTVVATQCQGTVLVFEKMYENRLFWVDRLIGMGARIILCDLHRAVVVGPSRLSGSYMTTPDIRAGMALLIAALGAEGTSEIHNIQQIDRGYEAIDTRLAALGARIRRERV
ncbi:MAG: UDP-N-acetylglucosamine 1-carboxyvinyltransferase [SAR324 cluster bacterium]|nr:UDP-N-acetylglucosamine 1-carboxyvinyltransferase [SAR324 cluster bacterium]MCZ6533168.1 UDP-N-acetylglucosamine 1-carboxyvinyltransferase [SAR324 cluster bacterium]MCZ6557762.1 UDP-N-acetylglucosamine 1-carboxyvinyltransferase [SAR324 cluster bacterium]MCZ6627053.1 UDP-N-acetylglucosamine 1-carboxyvinyltransferase [SAR324 cluster bacterium]MCZ6729155.1 UDP-N-acetylglucosamine 1-carboxyvinyltransferase [SAR324 cluster bacterium]